METQPQRPSDQAATDANAGFLAAKFKSKKDMHTFLAKHW